MTPFVNRKFLEGQTRNLTVVTWGGVTRAWGGEGDLDLLPVSPVSLHYIVMYYMTVYVVHYNFNM